MYPIARGSAATNRDLEGAIEESEFRRDLFYRLNVFRIELPPLRERREDIPDLARFFLSEFAQDLGKASLDLDQGALGMLESYAWPGNVRELRNLMERAPVLAETETIDPTLVGIAISEDSADPAEDDLDLTRAVSATERRMIIRALAAAADNKPRAAALLGIGERTLWTKLKKHRI